MLVHVVGYLAVRCKVVYLICVVYGVVMACKHWARWWCVGLSWQMLYTCGYAGRGTVAMLMIACVAVYCVRVVWLR